MMCRLRMGTGRKGARRRWCNWTIGWEVVYIVIDCHVGICQVRQSGSLDACILRLRYGVVRLVDDTTRRQFLPTGNVINI